MRGVTFHHLTKKNTICKRDTKILARIGSDKKYARYVEKDLHYRIFFMVLFPMFNVAIT